MRQFAAIVILSLVAVVAAQYKYQQPARQNVRPSSNSGIYSVQQSAPIIQYNQPSVPQQSYGPPQQLPLPQPAPVQVSLPQPLPGPVAVPQQNYLPPQQQTFAATQPQTFGVQQNFQQQQQFVGQQQQQFGGQQQLSYQGQQGGESGFQQQQNFQAVQRPTIISKDIYIHSAPEDQEDSTLDHIPDSGPIRKNYRIVFIKAPAHNLKFASAALKRAQATNEEKTVIYVLSKKPDLSEVQHQLQSAQGEQKTHKPEVYFIKYKTQEEAQRAQQEIQAQYDALGGSTHISDEGVAPITTVGGSSLNLGPSISSGAFNLSPSIGGNGGTASFVQSGGQQQSFVQQNYQSQSVIGSGGGSGYTAEAPSQKYLPANKKK